MPNWAWGTVEATGTREAVLAFSKRFIVSDEPNTCQGVKFFARSFMNMKRSEVEQEIKATFHGMSPDKEYTHVFNVDFAWSACSCLVNGYPQDARDKCVTLKDACMEDHVDVDIRTKEPGMWFEEAIHCNRGGDLQSSVQDLKCARCKNCGEKESIASYEDIDDLECSECGGMDFEMCEEGE
jgi:hypothetical protein